MKELGICMSMLGPKKGQQTAPKSPNYHGCRRYCGGGCFCCPCLSCCCSCCGYYCCCNGCRSGVGPAVVVGLVVSAERARAGQSPQVALCTNCSFLALEIVRRTVRSGTSDPKPQTLRVPAFPLPSKARGQGQVELGRRCLDGLRPLKKSETSLRLLETSAARFPIPRIPRT